MTTAKKLDSSLIENIKSEVKSNVMVEYILLMLTLRERNMGSTNLYRFKLKMLSEGFKFEDKDYKSAWQRLQSLGLGVIKHPRKNKFGEEFLWDYNLTDAANAAFEEGKILEFKKEHSEASPEPKEVVLTFPKRRGRPKGSKNRRKRVVKRRGPGRPKGSSNKKQLSNQELKILRSLLSRIG